MPLPLCHILRARLRQQGKGDKSTLPVRDNSKWSLQQVRHERVLWHGKRKRRLNVEFSDTANRSAAVR
jgi:hypothetical protein